MLDFSQQRTTVWTKLCGLRDAATAAEIARLHPDAIGLNFYEASVRYVRPEIAAEIVRTLPPGVAAVGVFVNAASETILRTIDAVGLHAVQFHGDEPPRLIAELKSARPDLPLIRAWRVGAEGLTPLADYLAACDRLGNRPDAILVDAQVSGSYGGTGTTVPRELLKDYQTDWPPLILAGGLNPENVAAAVVAINPFGVDTASGIESAPGVKDPQRAAAFLKAVRNAAESST